MKPLGTKFEYEAERNENLMRAYRQLLGDVCHISMPNIYDQLVDMPAERFWVSEERAAIVISKMLRGDRLSDMRPNKREMFREIYRRVKNMRKDNPSLSVCECVHKVVRNAAPKFYLTPGSAKVIICRIKQKWFDERKKKLRHLF